MLVLWVNLKHPQQYPDPAQVSVNSGIVFYHLNNYFISGSAGLLAARVLDNMTMKVEYFPNNTMDTASFDGNAQIYSR